MARNFSQNRSVGDTVTADALQDLNEEIDNIYAEGDDRGKAILAISTLALAIDIYPFTFRVNGVHGNSTGVTDFLLVDNAINYVEITQAGIISANQVQFNVDQGQIAKVTTAGGVITIIENRRADIIGGLAGNNGVGRAELFLFGGRR